MLTLKSLPAAADDNADCWKTFRQNSPPRLSTLEVHLCWARAERTEFAPLCAVRPFPCIAKQAIYASDSSCPSPCTGWSSSDCSFNSINFPSLVNGMDDINWASVSGSCKQGSTKLKNKSMECNSCLYRIWITLYNLMPELNFNQCTRLYFSLFFMSPTTTTSIQNKPI